MPLMTKSEVHALAHRIHSYRKQLSHHEEQKDMALAADALIAMSDLVAVAWPIAIGE